MPITNSSTEKVSVRVRFEGVLLTSWNTLINPWGLNVCRGIQACSTIHSKGFRSLLWETTKPGSSGRREIFWFNLHDVTVQTIEFSGMKRFSIFFLFLGLCKGHMICFSILEHLKKTRRSSFCESRECYIWYRRKQRWNIGVPFSRCVGSSLWEETSGSVFLAAFGGTGTFSAAGALRSTV